MLEPARLLQVPHPGEYARMGARVTVRKELNITPMKIAYMW